jgi:hypothetical protein
VEMAVETILQCLKGKLSGYMLRSLRRKVQPLRQKGLQENTRHNITRAEMVVVVK